MKPNYLFILGTLPFILAAAPTTPKGGIIRPTTTAVVTHPQTSATPVRPVTNVTVTRPESKGVVISHPTTAESEAAATSSAPATGGQNASAKSAAGNTVPSGNSPTSMSGFQGKQAIDFKAAQTGKTSFDLGGGKPDSAKDSTAKNSDAFKGIGGNLDQQLQKTNVSISQSKIANKVKKTGK